MEYLAYLILVAYVVLTTIVVRSAERKIRETDSAVETCHIRRRVSHVCLAVGCVYAATMLYMIFCEDAVSGMMVGLSMAFGSYMTSRTWVSSFVTFDRFQAKRFVLYLRGFKYDRYDVGAKEVFKSSFQKFTEAKFCGLLNLYMPTMAVGMTKEVFQPIGAKRIYLNDEEWEDNVRELIRKASAIVILVNDSWHCIWEIEKSIEYKRKLVLIVDDVDKFLNVKQHFNSLHTYHFPIINKQRPPFAIMYDSDLNPFTVEFSHTDKGYRSVVAKMSAHILGYKRITLSASLIKVFIYLLSIAFLIVGLYLSFLGISLIIPVIGLILSMLIPYFIYRLPVSTFKHPFAGT